MQCAPPALDARPFLRYATSMHELSLAAGLLALVDEELAKRGLKKLLTARVRHGALANVAPEALRFAFEALTRGGPHDGARLELEEEPLVLRCPCGESFSPVHPDQAHEWLCPCPACGERSGHGVETGRDVFLQRIEAE
jgi:hydrogenase nickel incorporation protein HypA/HybF